jgi:hypothetical protein
MAMATGTIVEQPLALQPGTLSLSKGARVDSYKSTRCAEAGGCFWSFAFSSWVAQLPVALLEEAVP